MSINYKKIIYPNSHGSRKNKKCKVGKEFIDENGHKIINVFHEHNRQIDFSIVCDLVSSKKKNIGSNRLQHNTTNNTYRFIYTYGLCLDLRCWCSGKDNKCSQYERYAYVTEWYPINQ
jgi:hypothetical protein